MSIIKIASKKAKNGYTYKVTFKYKDNGITSTYSKSGFLTKKEAQEHETLVKAQIKEYGGIKKECNKTLNDVYKEWKKTESKNYALHTIETYSYLYKKYAFETLGKKKITLIKHKELQKFFNDLEKSQSVCENLRKVVRNIFIFAIKNEYIETDPGQYIKISNKKSSKEKNEYLKHDDYLKIINALKNDEFRYKSLAIAIEISYHTGLRISEAFALHKKDFDFDNNTLIVNKQIQSQKGIKKEDYQATPYLKTSSSYATVPIAYQLKKELLEWFKINPYERVVCDTDGNYLCVYNANAQIKKKISHLNISFHFHMLRHTFITNLYLNNTDLKTAQKLARHKDIKTTLNIYTHIQEDNKINVINDVFNTIYSKNTPKTRNDNLVN